MRDALARRWPYDQWERFPDDIKRAIVAEYVIDMICDGYFRQTDPPSEVYHAYVEACYHAHVRAGLESIKRGSQS